VLAVLALGVPSLLALNFPPSATFLNQASALLGWGLFLLIGASTLTVGPWSQSRELSKPWHAERGAWAVTAALVLSAAAALLTLAAGESTSALVLSSVGMIAAALLAVLVGLAIARSGQTEPAFNALCIALVIAGGLSALVAIVQVFFPEWADGDWIAPPAVPGRASGNLRQPNHLCSLFLWTLVALAWLTDKGVLRRWLAGAMTVVVLFTLVLTASRTGWIGLIVFALWGLFDKRLTRSVRIALVAAFFVYWLLWGAMSGAAYLTHHTFYGAARMGAIQDISSSRFGIWKNTLSLIAQHPWFGVGWGEFNFAWSLTPFPGRPTAFFDHTHTLPLQFAVELGLPLALVLTLLFGYALWRMCVLPLEDANPERARTLRAASIMVLLIAVHSLLEYPLWYAYFLMPTAFMLGLGLGGHAASPSPTEAPATGGRSMRGWLIAGTVMLLVGAVASLIDYRRVVVVFDPPEDAAPLSERIEAGRHSWFFSHHANYAAATVAPHPSTVMPAFAEASHYLLDTRLMTAWARAYAEAGQVDKARYLAQRLREFRNEDSKPFFAPCEGAKADDPNLPFQCTAPTGTYSYRDFR
jgi:O-antigen ligase